MYRERPRSLPMLAITGSSSASVWSGERGRSRYGWGI